MLHRIVILNDSSVAKGGATGLAVLSARLFAARGYQVVFISGDDGEGADLHRDGIRHIPLGGALLLDRPKWLAARDGLYNPAIRTRLEGILATLDSPETVYHLHGWSRILSPSVFEALAPYSTRTFVHAHDYFLSCPNGVFYDYGQQQVCTRVAGSVGCLVRNCDKRSFAHKTWRAVRHVSLMHSFDQTLGWAGIVMIHPDMAPSLQRAGYASSRLTHVRNPATAFSQNRVKAEDNQTIAFIGRIEPGKGVEGLCSAASDAGAELVVIGEGSLRAQLEAAHPDVRFTGWLDRTQIGEMMQSVRALVMPSAFPEPFGLVAAEASMSGLPVILSTPALLSKDVARYELGWTFDPLRKGSLTQALLSCAALDRQNIAELSRRAAGEQNPLAQTPHDWAEALLSLYSSALSPGLAVAAE